MTNRRTFSCLAGFNKRSIADFQMEWNRIQCL
ncbi:hypothetical protein EMIT0158MI4_150005 [Burkholderia ambifaria]